MTATLYTFDGSLVGPAKISDFRAWPTHLIVSPREGGLRMFVRHGSNTGDGVYDEVRPVVAELIKGEPDAG